MFIDVAVGAIAVMVLCAILLSFDFPRREQARDLLRRLGAPAKKMLSPPAGSRRPL
ncbi:MAG: hypothetical protein ACT4QA_11725 [Panacagrimonas sp.]